MFFIDVKIFLLVLWTGTIKVVLFPRYKHGRDKDFRINMTTFLWTFK